MTKDKEKKIYYRYFDESENGYVYCETKGQAESCLSDYKSENDCDENIKVEEIEMTEEEFNNLPEL